MNMENAMWSEKYRPETLDEVVGQEAAVERLRKFLNNKPGELPHLLLSGPPGVGKTATVVSFAKEYYGDEFDSNFREFNASDDRGIDVIREDVKSWCRRAPSGGYPYKIIFLDEADQLTSDAQPALRRVMEQYSDSTRFSLSCNYVNEIMGPLQSRCSTLHFGRVDDEHVREMVDRIVEGEEIEASEEALSKVVRSARGQVRDAVLTLQTSVMEGELTEAQVELTTGVVDDQLTRDILELALGGELDEAQTRLDVDVLKSGADPHALIDSIFRTLRSMDVPPDYRAKAFELLAEIEERIQHGLNPHVQFHALLAHLHMSQGLSPISQQAGGQK